MAYLIVVAFISEDSELSLGPLEQVAVSVQTTNLGSNYFCCQCGNELSPQDFVYYLRLNGGIEDVEKWCCEDCRN